MSRELADAFLADFDSGDDAPADDQQPHSQEQQANSDSDSDSSDEDMNDGEQEAGEDAEAEEEKITEQNFDAATKILHDVRLTAHFQRLDQMKGRTLTRDEEYPLIVASNQLVVELDNAVARVHRFVRDLYASKFPELESLLTNPIDYVKMVQRIGNATDLSKIGIEGLVPAHTVMVIKITATTSVGKALSDDKLALVMRACAAVLELEEFKKRLYEYIASRMNVLAPNLCMLVGSEIAARLMALAGGLLPLSNIPASNLLVLGQKKRSAAEFSRSQAGSTQVHAGLVFESAIVKSVPADMRRKAAKMVAGRAALAARVDAYNEDASAAQGRQWHDEISKRLTKMQEPPPMKQHKALPAPIDKPKKRRGGKRFRKFKAQFEVTELAKQANRMEFNKAQAEDETTGTELGMIGSTNTGKVRMTLAKDTQKLGKKAANKFGKQARFAPGIMGGDGGSAIAGTQTTLTLTARQGIELVDPTVAAARAREKLLAEGTATYFSAQTGFISAKR